MILSAQSREILQRWWPMIAVLLCLWLAARRLRDGFWTMFGMFWMIYWTSKTMPFWR